MAQLPLGSGWPVVRARKVAATLALMQNAAGWAELRAKATAPWQDLTALARGGLFAEAEIGQGAAAAAMTGGTSTRIGMTLSHTMAYGKWLETVGGAAMGRRAGMAIDELTLPQFAGPYASIHPTINALIPGLRAGALRIWRA